LTEKSHMERSGLHRPSSILMAPKKLIWHQITRIHRSHLWNRPGSRMRVSSETTASFGMLSSIMPRQKVTVVHKGTPCCCSVVRRAICFPVPKDTTATVDEAAVARPHIYMQSQII
jgi:hypothetical protein